MRELRDVIQQLAHEGRPDIRHTTTISQKEQMEYKIRAPHRRPVIIVAEQPQDGHKGGKKGHGGRKDPKPARHLKEMDTVACSGAAGAD